MFHETAGIRTGNEYYSAGSGGEWHSRFGGRQWKYDEAGIETLVTEDIVRRWRTPGEPITVRAILHYYRDEIEAASRQHGVAPALIIMTIATETAALRDVAFTGPKSFRWEKNFRLRPGNGPGAAGEYGDYSAGPMQTMSSTARWLNREINLGHDESRDLPFFGKLPPWPPARLGLYEPRISIDIGAAYIARHRETTGDNPILVAAVYNSGSLRQTSINPWHIYCHGNHLDRAAQWYGDACAVLQGQGAGP